MASKEIPLLPRRRRRPAFFYVVLAIFIIIVAAVFFLRPATVSKDNKQIIHTGQH
jgi:hypothetical protein